MNAAADSVSVAVVPAGGRIRLDLFLAAEGMWGTRSQVQRLIEEGRVWVNDGAARAGARLKPGDVVRVASRITAPVTQAAEPEDIPLAVLYEDDELMIIDKPAGLVVHPAPGNWRGTLVSALLYRWKGRRDGLDANRPGIVHRLDRDTSGVLVVGKTAAVVMRLAAQFRARKVRKEYLALVWRCPRARSGVIDKPIGRHRVQRKRMAVLAGGRAAVTRYEVVEDFGDSALLRVFPETGRTHQIRVHLAAIGHPIVGDAAYGRSRAGADPRLLAFRRQALHAAAIEFRHPRGGERLIACAPEPEDLRELLAYLRSRPRRDRAARPRS